MSEPSDARDLRARIETIAVDEQTIWLLLLFAWPEGVQAERFVPEAVHHAWDALEKIQQEQATRDLFRICAIEHLVRQPWWGVTRPLVPVSGARMLVPSAGVAERAVRLAQSVEQDLGCLPVVDLDLVVYPFPCGEVADGGGEAPVHR